MLGLRQVACWLTHLDDGQLGGAGLLQSLDNEPGALVVLDVRAHLANDCRVPVAVQIVILDLCSTCAPAQLREWRLLPLLLCKPCCLVLSLCRTVEVQPMGAASQSAMGLTEAEDIIFCALVPPVRAALEIFAPCTAH